MVNIMVNIMVNVMLEIRKKGCVVGKCEFECGGFDQNPSTRLIGNGVYAHSHPNKHTQTQFYPRAKMVSRSEATQLLIGTIYLWLFFKTKPPTT